MHTNQYIGNYRHNGNDNSINVVSNLISYDPRNIENEGTYVSTHIGIHNEYSDITINSIEDESTYVSTTIDFISSGENNVIYADMYVSTTTGDEDTYASMGGNDDSEAIEGTYVNTANTDTDNINTNSDRVYVNNDIDISNRNHIENGDSSIISDEHSSASEERSNAPEEHFRTEENRPNLLSRVLHSFRHLHDQDAVNAGYFDAEEVSTSSEEHSNLSEEETNISEESSNIQENRNIFSRIFRSFRHIHDQDMIPTGYYNPDELD
jgi:hypothetical protein